MHGLNRGGYQAARTCPPDILAQRRGHVAVITLIGQRLSHWDLFHCRRQRGAAVVCRLVAVDGMGRSRVAPAAVATPSSPR
jgi:hypothetical protein